MLDPQSISFGSLVPASGFRWLHKDSGGQWHAAEPPEDWPEADYEAAREGAQAKLTEAFYIAASGHEIIRAQVDQNSRIGAIKSIPDLYLLFASERATPRMIQDCADQFGLLRDDRSELKIPRKDPDFLYFRAETAAFWVTEFELARCRLELSKLPKVDMDNAEAVEVVSSYLDWSLNPIIGGRLSLQLKLDEATGVIRSEMIASSLADLVRIQLGVSVAANVVHRQCAECTTWFAVHPMSGRPDKIYCSNACRMRAYRKRKSMAEKAVR
jgi:hypothetical protein